MKHFFCLSLVILAAACNSSHSLEIRNARKGSLKATQKLEVVEEKRFPLDSFSAPKPQFLQLYADTSGVERLAVLNTYAKSINLYDYASPAALGSISVAKTNIPLAFYLKNTDSVFVYDDQMMELVLLSKKPDTISRISLIGNENIKDISWVLKYPQYIPRSVNVIAEIAGKIFFPGQYIWSIPDSIAPRFQFVSMIDVNKKEVSRMHKYPAELYGNGYIWDEPAFNMPYHDIIPASGKVVYSFPVSHDLYIYDLRSDSVSKVYGGCEAAGDIVSMDKSKFGKGAPHEYIYDKACMTDLYGGVKYDKYRNVYYRFLRKGLPQTGARLRMENKKLFVIIFDKDFKYLGETEIGDMNTFFPDNSFVTKEGLNIEYLDPEDVEEKYLRFKIYQAKNI